MFFTTERINRIITELGDDLHHPKQQLTSIRFTPCDYNAYELLHAPDTDWADYEPRQNWGGKDQHHWFRTTFEMPAQFAGKRAILLVQTGRTGWDALNPQFLAFVNGEIAQGLDVNHTEILLTDNAQAGATYQIDLYAYTGMTDAFTELEIFLCGLEVEIEKLYYHLQVPLQVSQLLDKEEMNRITILNHLTEAINLLDLRQPFSDAFYASIRNANNYLDSEFYDKVCGDGTVTEVCVGHTHIDVAWLWTLTQTREKAVRTFATVIKLMEQYPDYIFMSSQPQLYQYVKEDSPELYARIVEMVQAGRWEVEGAMWLEADCNLASGESLVRQILHGKRFFREEFGVDSKVLWLPDVFGYSAALPQILKRSGVDYFMTTKISWNEFNRMPYDTFTWKGLDGTGILTYFISTQEYDKSNTATGTTYNGDTTPSQVKGGWHRYQQKAINSTVLNCYGFGDGGGGPTKPMLERLERLNKGIPGMPRTQTGKVLDFFRDLDARVGASKRLPEWVGELYLEYHRGTYTSMARNKKANRKAEFRNQDIEWLASLGGLLFGAEYPQHDLHRFWRTTLLNQFHDIIPGSSIREVYEDSKAEYAVLERESGALLARTLEGIAQQVNTSSDSVVVFNQLGFVRSDIVTIELPQGWEFADVLDGNQPVTVQKVGDSSILFCAQNVPSKGYKTFTLRRAVVPAQPASDLRPTADAQPDHMENDFFAIAIGADGTLTSIYDKRAEREVLQSGARGNVLQAFEDKPFQWDAWNIDIYYQEKMWEVDDVQEVRVVESGPVRWGVEVRRRFLDSTITQTIYIYRDIARIDFATEIDWKETQVLLKAAFPVDIHAEKASYEIQFGNVERPTHWNTSWDWARFEVCAHKWADLSEEGYGVSLLNDCKYGHDIRNSNMRLTLLKSATYPNEDADREQHSFTYALYPHQQGWRQSETAEMAYSLNCPLYAVVTPAHTGALPASFALVQTASDNVMIEVVKQAEAGAEMIVRLYEYKNVRSSVTLSFGKPVRAVLECDLMENEQAALPVEGNAFTFQIKPYEIRTFKVAF